jgi:hypothetical protein
MLGAQFLFDVEIASLFARLAQLDEATTKARACGSKDLDGLTAARAGEYEALGLAALRVFDSGFCGGAL